MAQDKPAIIPEHWYPFATDREFFFVWAVDKLTRQGAEKITDENIRNEMIANAPMIINAPQDLKLEDVHALTGKLMAEKYIECEKPHATTPPQLRSSIQLVKAEDIRLTPVGKRAFDAIMSASAIDPDKNFAEQAENALRAFPLSWRVKKDIERKR